MGTDPAGRPLPPLSFYILLALVEGVAHGWAVIKRIRALTAGAANPSSGSLYMAMLRLEEQGLVEAASAPAVADGDDQRRRYYRLTAPGRRVLRAEAVRLERLLEHARRHRLLPRPAGPA